MIFLSIFNCIPGLPCSSLSRFNNSQWNERAGYEKICDTVRSTISIEFDQRTVGRQFSILSPPILVRLRRGAWKARQRETNPSVSPCMWQKVSTSIHPPHLYSFLDKSILCRARSCKAMLLVWKRRVFKRQVAKPIHLSDLSRWWSTKLKIMYQFYTSLPPLSRWEGKNISYTFLTYFEINIPLASCVGRKFTTLRKSWWLKRKLENWKYFSKDLKNKR